MCFPYSHESHTILSFIHLHFFRKYLAHRIEGHMAQSTMLEYHLASLSLATTVRAVHTPSSLSRLSKYRSPLCLTPTPSLLPVFRSSYTIVLINIIRQSISSIKELIDTKLTRNDGTCKTEDNVIDGVYFTVPTPLIG